MNSNKKTIMFTTIAISIAMTASIALFLSSEKDPMSYAGTGNLIRLSRMVEKDPSLVNLKREDGLTILHIATANNQLKIVDCLIKNGANVNECTEYGSPLHTSVRENNSKITEMLLSNGADANAQNDWGQTPLHMISYRSSPEVVSILLKNGANPKATDDEGRTPLHRGKNAEIAKILIDSGVNVNQADNQGFNALHWAATHREIVDEPTILFLLEHGASTTALNNDGLTPLEMAKKNNQKKLVEILEQWEKK